MRTNQLIKNEQLRKKIISYFPQSLLRLALDFLFLPRYITGKYRLLPDFIIIGAQRAGTTSLYYNLTNHPNVAPAFHKEIEYFDTHFDKGINWYKAHFKFKGLKKFNEALGRTLITGEASTFYIVHPQVPERIYRLIPDIKLIVMLRNPIDRAISHYHHETRLGYEDQTFEDAIKLEEIRLQGEIDKLKKDENYYSYNAIHFGYLSRGIYANQLTRWLERFPRENFHFICSENFYQNTSVEFNRVLNFLNLPSWEPKDYHIYNSGGYDDLSPILRNQLTKYFQPYNQQLYNLLGTDFGW